MQSISFIFYNYKTKWCPFLFLGYPLFPFLTSLHVPYATYIVNAFHSVKLNLHTVTSIYNIRKMDQK